MKQSETLEGCIFCQIGSGISPAEIEYEDDYVVAFWDVTPKAPIHIIVAPKGHIKSIEDIDETHTEILGKMVLAAKKVAAKKDIDEKGYRIYFNKGPHSGQIVEHFHLHLIGGKKLNQLS
ncbi:HIT domain-containing protein [Patescibacteria group bacterium]